MPGVGFVVIQTSRPFPVFFIWHTVSLREVRMSSAPATMNSANDYYLCVWGSAF